MEFIKIYFLLIILLSFTNSNIINKELILNNSNINMELNEAVNFKIIPQSNLIPNNIKIQIDGKNPNNSYIISYYKSISSFEERNQLSQSFSGKAFMWLNKKQISNNFSIIFECSDSPCEYSLNIIPK